MTINPRELGPRVIVSNYQLQAMGPALTDQLREQVVRFGLTFVYDPKHMHYVIYSPKIDRDLYLDYTLEQEARRDKMRSDNTRMYPHQDDLLRYLEENSAFRATWSR